MKAALPTVTSGNAQVDAFCGAVKQNMDQITGQQKNVPVLVPLESTATLAETITQLNAILARMQ